MKTACKPATAPRTKPRRQSAPSKRNGLALESFDIPDSAVKKCRTERERRAAFDRFAAEFGPKDDGRKRKTVDAVGFLIKLRRGRA